MLSTSKRREDEVGRFIRKDVVALDYLFLGLAVRTSTNLSFILCAPGLILMKYMRYKYEEYKGVLTKKMMTEATERFKPAAPTDEIMRTRDDGSSQKHLTIFARC